MALFKDYITTKGQRMLARMLTGEVENLQFTRVVLGDGENKNPEEATEVISPICEAAIESIALSNNNVLSITATFTNEDMESGFYMREKGLYLNDGNEEVLAIYANAGSTASYIEPAASGLIKKVIRSSIVFSQADIVNVTLMDSGYANAVDFNNHLKDKENPHGVTAKDVGLGNVPNVITNDQEPTYTTPTTLAKLESGEKLSTAFGKLAKAVEELISHIGNKNKPHAITITDPTPYTKKVIGLIRLDTSSYCGGTLEFNRTNGVTRCSHIEFTLQNIYNNTEKFYCDYKGWGFTELYPVTFNYNGIPYAGFYFYNAAPQQENIMLDAKRRGVSMEPLLIDVYDANSKSVVNEEIYNSLTYDKYSSSIIRVPGDIAKVGSDGNLNLFLKSSDLVKNLTTTTEGMPLDATIGKALQDEIDEISTELGKEEIITISFPKATVAAGTTLAVKDYVSSGNATKAVIGCEIIGCYMSGGPGGSGDGDYSVISSSAYYNTNKYLYIGTTKNLSGFAPILAIKDPGVADSANSTVTVKIRVTYS